MKQNKFKLLSIVAVVMLAASCQKESKLPQASVNAESTDEATSAVPPKIYLSRALFEDYTGTWCGWCPRLAYKFDLMETNNPRFFFVGNHNGDALTSSVQTALEKEFKVSAFPTGKKMRDWDASGKSISFKDNGNIMNLADTSQASDYLKTNDSLGLAITGAAISGNTISGTVKVGFGFTYTDTLKVVIELVEDSIVLSQHSYYNTSPVGNPYYGLGNDISNFVHHNVLRKVSTATFGDLIPKASTMAGKEYSKAFSFDATGYNKAHCKIVAFVVGSKYNKKNKGIVNVQWANAGKNKAYDKIQ